MLTGLLLCIGFVANSQDLNLTVVSNTVGAPASLKTSELTAIMMGEKQRWQNGKKITIVMVKTNKPIGKVTCQKLYKMSGDEVNKFWLSLVFQGKAQAPVFFNTPQEVQNYVSQNEGSIGILNDTTTTDDVKIVLIDGKKMF